MFTDSCYESKFLLVKMATSRFVQLSPEELLKLQRKQQSLNTVRSTKFGVNLLQKYLVATGSETKVEEIQPAELNEILISFYSGARTEKGESYKLNSLKNLRFSIQRYYLEKRGIDIIADPLFKTSNNCLILAENRLFRSR